MVAYLFINACIMYLQSIFNKLTNLIYDKSILPEKKFIDILNVILKNLKVKIIDI